MCVMWTSGGCAVAYWSRYGRMMVVMRIDVVCGACERMWVSVMSVTPGDGGAVEDCSVMVIGVTLTASSYHSSFRTFGPNLGLTHARYRTCQAHHAQRDRLLMLPPAALERAGR